MSCVALFIGCLLYTSSLIFAVTSLNNPNLLADVIDSGADDIIIDELNIKAVEFGADLSTHVNFEIKPNPVSYTHLDVYKRQSFSFITTKISN